MGDGFHLAFARRDPLRGRELGIVSPELPEIQRVLELCKATRMWWKS